jgi:hypothetical protein
MSRGGRLWHWLWTPSSLAPKPTETWHCPECGREVEIVSPGIAMKRMGFWMRPNDRELLGHCPVHGHPPWNSPAPD